MRSSKIFSTLFCAGSILADICAPRQGTPTLQVVPQGSVENCAVTSKPLVLQPSGGPGKSAADCIVGGGSQVGGGNVVAVKQQPQICTSQPPASLVPPQIPPMGPPPVNGMPPMGPPMQGYPGQGVPMVPAQGVPMVPMVPLVPTTPGQPGTPGAPGYPPAQAPPQTPTNVTQVFHQPPPQATTIIQPPPYTPQPPTNGTDVPPTSNVPPQSPPKNETQCVLKNIIDCVPVGPEEEVQEPPATPQTPPNTYGPPPQTVVHVNVPPSQAPPAGPPAGPPAQGVLQPCIITSNPPVYTQGSGNGNGSGSAPCVPSAAPGVPAGPPQKPTNTLYVPNATQTPSTGSSMADCTSPSSMINSLCDTSAQQQGAMNTNKGQGVCEIPNNNECLQKLVNSPPQVTPQDAMECVTQPRTLVDVGVLAPASDAYLQAHQNVCVY